MQRRAETFIVINQSAARARGVWHTVRTQLDAADVCYEAHEARGFGDAATQTRAALRAGYRTIAVIGGDGTLSEVVAGFFERPAALGHRSVPVPISAGAVLAILPGGTGNDFARSIEGQRATLDYWLARLLAHCRTPMNERTTRRVDLLQGCTAAHSFLCLNAATLGIGAEVAGRVAAQQGAVRRLSGEARFALAAVQALARWRMRRMRVQVDDEVWFECRTNLIAVVNSRYAGGGMMFAPDARVDDGLLDVVTACGIGRASIVRELTRIHSGGHLANSRVRVLHGRRVRIEPLTPQDALAIEADGDMRGHTPLEFRVLPGALRVVV